MTKSWIPNFLVVALSVLLAGVVHAGINQWTTTGPVGRSVFTLAVDPQTPTTVYAGTDQGVFKSTNSGASWALLPTPFFSEIPILALDPANPAVLYAAYHRVVDDIISAGVFKSTDGGGSWTTTNLQGARIGALVVDRKTPTTLYAVVDESVHKSVDGGTNWRPSGNGIIKPVLSLAIDETNPTVLYAGGGSCRPGGLEIICEGGVFQSTDGGTRWGEVGLTGVAVSFLTVIPTQPATVYASGQRSILGVETYRSVDAGQSWTVTGGIFWAIVSDPTNPSILYAAGRGSATRSLDGGQHWTSITARAQGSNPFFFVAALAVAPTANSTLYVATRSGVFALEITETFTPDMVATVESPEAEQAVSGIGMFRGWAFVTRPAVPIVDVDASLYTAGARVSATTAPCCSERQDVQVAFPQFPAGNTRNSGWGGVVNWGTLNSGPQQFSLSIGSDDGDFFLSTPQTIRVVKPGDFEFLDQFALASATTARVGDELLLSGVVVREKASQQQKQVNLRFRWFTNSQSFGLTQADTVTTLSSNRTLVGPVLVRMANWLRGSLTFSVPAPAQAAGEIRSNWESPEEGQVAAGLALVRGWAFPEQAAGDDFDAVETMHLSIDGTPAGTVPCCTYRDDVRATFPTLTNGFSGWGMQLNYGNLTPGMHTLTLRLETSTGMTQTLTRTVHTLRIGGFTFVDQCDVSGATARIEGEEVVLSGVRVRDKASQQTKVIEVRLRWFQHAQALGIVASN